MDSLFVCKKIKENVLNGNVASFRACLNMILLFVIHFEKTSGQTETIPFFYVVLFFILRSAALFWIQKSAVATVVA